MEFELKTVRQAQRELAAQVPTETKYAGLQAGGVILQICSAVEFVGAFASIMMSLVRQRTDCLPLAAILAGAGAIFLAAGAACHALRDIAINSFRR